MVQKSKKSSQNMTSILALIVGLAALAIAIIALVNNKKDGYSPGSSCCTSSCAESKDGWCIGTDESGNLTFNYGGDTMLTLSSTGLLTPKNYAGLPDFIENGQAMSLQAQDKNQGYGYLTCSGCDPDKTTSVTVLPSDYGAPTSWILRKH